MDLLIAARGEDSGGDSAGAVYVIYGDPGLTDTDLSAADAKFTGEAANAQIGWGVSLASAGDTNGDGYADIVIGARYDSEAARYAGGAYIIEVGLGTASLSTAQACSSASPPATTPVIACMAPAMSTMMDSTTLIGSGYSDVGNTNAGVVYMVRGPVSGTSSLANATGRIAATGKDRARGRGVGDIDNDGIPDIMPERCSTTMREPTLARPTSSSVPTCRPSAGAAASHRDRAQPVSFGGSYSVRVQRASKRSGRRPTTPGRPTRGTVAIETASLTAPASPRRTVRD